MHEDLSKLNERWLELMRDGRFKEAWRISDHALSLRAALDCAAWPRHLQFIWRGQSLDGQRVLVRCYHGLGDTLQFVRLLEPLRRRARHVTLWVQAQLIPLLRSLPFIDRMIPLHDSAPDAQYDVDLELAELMHALRVKPEDLGAKVPYLNVGPRSHTAHSGPYQVGIAWRAGEWDDRRSIPCELLAPLGSIRGIDWIVMQRGPALEEWRHSFGRIPEVQGICDEARVMQTLDLLVSVDTCSAHLAGALGIPVWTLLHRHADWRWMQSRADTPWYPSMRLVRQTYSDQWRTVLSEVSASLSRLACARA